MMVLSGIALESPAGLLQKFRRHAEIHLRMADVNMPQVDGQKRQQPLHIGPLLIPRRHAMHGERVTQVVNPGLLGAVCSANPGTVAENAEVVLERIRFHRVA